ncbi:MAG TPA: hypothetical protein VK553_10520 [Candidatus Nitrosopolaris rasttigaisensis]|nr:hypothetical protein [Candidatus Nitrosopolaris rasttigaisensis]
MKKVLLLLAISTCLTGCWERANGEKVGVIVKCASEGAFIKTYECEMIRGGLSGASGVMGQSFHFTVENKNDIPLVDKALAEQKEVHIKYHKEWITMWRTETSDNSFLDEIG